MTQRYARNAKGRFLRLARGRYQLAAGGTCTACCGTTCQWCAASGSAAALVCPPTTGIVLTFSGVNILSKSAIESMYPELKPPPDGYAPAPSVSPSTLGSVNLFNAATLPADYGCFNIYVSESPIITTTVASRYIDGSGGPRTSEAYFGVNYGCGATAGSITFGQSTPFSNSLGTSTAYGDNPTFDERAGFTIFEGTSNPSWPRACSRTTGSASSSVSTSNGAGGVNGQTYPIADGGSVSVTGTYSPPFCGSCAMTSIVIGMSIAATTYQGSPVPAFACTAVCAKVPAASAGSGGADCQYVANTTIAGYPMRVRLNYVSQLSNQLFVGWTAIAEYTTAARPAGVPSGWTYGGSKRCRGSIDHSPTGGTYSTGRDADTVTVS